MNLAYDVHDFSAIQERYHILDQSLRCLALGSQPCRTVLGAGYEKKCWFQSLYHETYLFNTRYHRQLVAFENIHALLCHTQMQ